VFVVGGGSNLRLMASRGPAHKPAAASAPGASSALLVLSVVTAALVVLMWISVGVRLASLATALDANVGRRLDQLDASLKLMRDALSEREDGKQRESMMKV